MRDGGFWCRFWPCRPRLLRRLRVRLLLRLRPCLPGRRVTCRRRLGAFLEQADDLVDLGGEEVEGGEDAAVGAEPVLPHHLAVVDRVADVDVAAERHARHGRVEVDDVGRRALRVEVGVDPLHESCFAGAWRVRELAGSVSVWSGFLGVGAWGEVVERA